MSAAAVTTLVKMVEALPDPVQEQVLARVREYVADYLDELEWDRQFAQSQDWLEREAERVRREIAAGRCEIMDFDRL